jgi:hypothetical protein
MATDDLTPTTEAHDKTETVMIDKSLQDTQLVGVATYREDGTQRIYVFAAAKDNELYVNYWDGGRWRWAKQGKPPGSTSVGGHRFEAITYREGNSQRIYCFSSVPKHLYVNYWDGQGWHWADQGRPPDLGDNNTLQSLSAITYREASKQRIYVFVGSLYGGQWVNYWDGEGWHWAYQGGEFGLGGPEAITYEFGGVRRIYVFSSSGPSSSPENGRLYVNYWDGQGWHWANQGQPSPDIDVVFTPSVVSYFEGGSDRIYAFVQGDHPFPSDPRLYVRYWDGQNWRWANQNAQPGGPSFDVGFKHSSITYLDSDNKRRIYNFVLYDGGPLYVNWWDGAKWHWDNHGKPPTPLYAGTPLRAITYREGTSQRIYIFFVSQAGHLWVRYWDGAQWHWADQGMPT